MLIYRFKITSEDHDEFAREICIQPGQKFIDFYHCIIESAELIPAEQASFFLTDKKYKKDREISLNQIEKHIKRYDPELDEMIPVVLIPKLMKVTKLNAVIEDPHQRMLFEYHGKEYFTFLIELIKIVKTDDKDLYPKCVKWVGELPKKMEPLIIEDKKEKEHKESDLIASVIPDLDLLSKLNAIEEDEAELADIEKNLGELLFGDTKKQNDAAPIGVKLKKKSPPPLDESVSIFEDEEEGKVDEDEAEDLSDGMEHLEDYDNIENIEIKYAKFSDDTDDE